ncbi:MAG: DUF1573 domain-containing protein [Pirellulales bacterium]|nr:DUF1573 domain-containing protein [Pirellulales bacterium]
MWQQRTITLAAALVALAGATGLAYLSRAPEVGDLGIEPAERDFGRVSQNERLPARFRVVNPNEATVSIVRVVKTCDCAKPRLSQTTLGPRQAATLDVTWEVGTRHGPSRASVTLVTASSARSGEFRHAQATLVADVQADFQIEPEEVVFKASNAGDRQFVAFASLASSKIEILGLHPTHAALAVERDAAGAGFWVSLNRGKWPADRQGAEVIVETSSKTEPRRTLVVRVE